MTDSERLKFDADAKDRLASKSQEEFDLRAGQIEKLRQEMEFYTAERDKHIHEKEELIRRADELAAKEHHDDEQRKKDAALNLAISMSNDQ